MNLLFTGMYKLHSQGCRKDQGGLVSVLYVLLLHIITLLMKWFGKIDIKAVSEAWITSQELDGYRFSAQL